MRLQISWSRVGRPGLPARLLRDQNRQPSVAHGTLQDADLMAQRKILQSEFTLRSEERASGSGQTSGDVQHDPSGMPGLPEILKDFAADQFLVGTGSRLVLIEGNSVPGSSNPGRSTEWWSAAGSRPLAASAIDESAKRLVTASRFSKARRCSRPTRRIWSTLLGVLALLPGVAANVRSE